ncbi:MAG: hypothetical protein AAFV29_26260 [Myxococcota bacterium]
MLSALTRDHHGRLVFIPQYLGGVETAIRSALNALYSHQEIQRLLQIIVALEEQLGAPEAAETLRRMVRAQPGILEYVQKNFMPAEGTTATRRFAASQGREVHLNAPRVDESPPADSLKVSKLFNASVSKPPPRVRAPTGLRPSPRSAAPNSTNTTSSRSKRIRRGLFED